MYFFPFCVLPIGCSQRKQTIDDFIKQFIPSEKSEGIFLLLLPIAEKSDSL